MRFRILKLVFLFTIFAACSTEDAAIDGLKEIEKNLKDDKTRPGKVGTLRALEVIQKTRHIATHPCPLPLGENFEGRLKSTLNIQIFTRSGSTLRRLQEERLLEVSKKITKLTTEKNTIDEIGIEHHLKRSWIFDGKTALISATVGKGEITGPRPAAFDEKEKIIDAALSSFLSFRPFVQPECVYLKNQNIDAKFSEITLDASEISGDAAKIVWRANSDGRLIKVSYSHQIERKTMALQMPSYSGTLEPQGSGFESAIDLIEILRTEKLIK